MKRHSFWRFAGLIFFSIIMSACSTPPIKAVWKSPSYLARPQRVMVIAIAREPIYRRIIEDEFVLQFKLRGVDSVASYATLPDKSQNDPVAIEQMVKQLGSDSVLMSRLVNRHSVRQYYPAPIQHRPIEYGNWPDYFNESQELLKTPRYSIVVESVLMETNLYDVKNDELVWAATTETGVQNLNQTLIKPYIGNIINMMKEYGLLR